MEAILSLVGLVIFLVVVNLVFRGLASSGKAAFNAARGRGSFKENFEYQFSGMGDFQIQAKQKTVGEDDNPFEIVEIQGKGLLPVSQRTTIGCIVSVFDKRDGDLVPVLSILEDFQEPETIVYQCRREITTISPDQGFAMWVPMGLFIPETLTPPVGGLRTLTIIARIVDMNFVPPINAGFLGSKTGIVAQAATTFTYRFEEKGYEETAKEADIAREMCVRLAMAVAFSDGSLDPSEGKVIQQWILKVLKSEPESRQEKLKSLLNGALKSSYDEASNRELSFSDLTRRLNDIGSKAYKYEAIELCLDVMAADGVAEESELEDIRRIADALELDFDEIQKMKDQRLLKVNVVPESGESLEALLGIDPGWEPNAIKKHLRTEFTKWNGRIQSLPEGQERTQAQKMLDLIAEARRKYA
ncbi:TerB family tellurite resistance protein [Pseudodesulfovibrio portus]|uniref:Co-chaperone DjlA N-terminal domain-containing protein n=1 Tax=Pseudodesulfovibrio portus TaxID=231439 RepID=A0ABM8AQ20_9BACT|nr:TerB family tellurite resistance protein [Pseudodesulfovibrio portus]BDQ33404.1 hypothetical protein JCM14722_09460 [Pseudodesulfovibrio portus]